MTKFKVALAALFAFTTTAFAQSLPSGSTGIVTNNTPNTWQTYSYAFTPSTSGANFIGFAFRQDPAFWTFDNVALTASGSSTNLLTNGAFNTGGAFSVTTNNGPSSMQAPTNWGVWYQNGTYPAAAGTWMDTGGTHGGVWYDGAVGSFDGIYQGVNLTAGQTYTISFEVSGNHTSNNGSVQLGVYGGPCDSVSIAASSCTIPASVGFTTLATPSQGAAAGGGSTTPTLVSELAGTPTVTTSTTYGTPVVATRIVDTSTNDRVRFNVSRTTAPITSTPYTITTTTTPNTVETYSDGSTVVINETSTTTTSTGSSITVGQSATQTKTISASGSRDSIRARNMNLFFVDPLSTNDGSWAAPYAGYISSVGSYRMQGAAFGWQRTVENNTFGIAANMNSGRSGNQTGSGTESDSYSGTAYLLSKQSGVWLKAAMGYGSTDHRTKTEILEFGMLNTSKVRQNNFYADVGGYSPGTFFGFRILGGAVINYSDLKGTDTGSTVLSSLPANGGTTKVTPYVGARYEYDRVAMETRLYTNTEYKTIVTTKVSINQPIMNNVHLNATIGVDKGISEKYNNVYGLVGLKIVF